MHPDVLSEQPGKCPKCGMKLVKQSDIMHVGVKDPTEKTYRPLIVVISMIFLVALTLSFKDLFFGLFNLKQSLAYVMVGFFLVFSAFKLMDLKGFAAGYSTYDLLAKKWIGYGYIYPFIELAFGLLMLLTPNSKALLLLELIVMLFSGIGVAIKIAKREKFQCACLGTFLKVPLTKVTLVEDFGMALLALVMFLL